MLEILTTPAPWGCPLGPCLKLPNLWCWILLCLCHLSLRSPVQGLFRRLKESWEGRGRGLELSSPNTCKHFLSVLGWRSGKVRLPCRSRIKADSAQNEMKGENYRGENKSYPPKVFFQVKLTWNFLFFQCLDLVYFPLCPGFFCSF